MNFPVFMPLCILHERQVGVGGGRWFLPAKLTLHLQKTLHPDPPAPLKLPEH